MGKHPFKILCIDGGGIKGLFSAQILAKFEEVYDTKISEQFDLICGTSTGGIIALAASANISMSDVVNFYKEKGPKIFAQKRKKNLGKLWLKIKQICYKGKYSNEGEFYQFNLSSCIRQQNSLTAQFVSFSLSNLANIFYPPNFYNN